MEDREYKQLYKQSLKYYSELKPLYCPALKREVNFNQRGFKHLIYKKGLHRRDVEVQSVRFKALDLAVKLIGLTTTLQEYEVREVNKSNETFWCFIAIFEDQKIKVVVRKNGENGMPHFWSVIPGWSTGKRDEFLMSFMKGNPKID